MSCGCGPPGRRDDGADPRHTQPSRAAPWLRRDHRQLRRRASRTSAHDHGRARQGGRAGRAGGGRHVRADAAGVLRRRRGTVPPDAAAREARSAGAVWRGSRRRAALRREDARHGRRRVRRSPAGGRPRSASHRRRARFSLRAAPRRHGRDAARSRRAARVHGRGGGSVPARRRASQQLAGARGTERWRPGSRDAPARAPVPDGRARPDGQEARPHARLPDGQPRVAPQGRAAVGHFCRPGQRRRAGRPPGGRQPRHPPDREWHGSIARSALVRL